MKNNSYLLRCYSQCLAWQKTLLKIDPYLSNWMHCYVLYVTKKNAGTNSTFFVCLKDLKLRCRWILINLQIHLFWSNQFLDWVLYIFFDVDFSSAFCFRCWHRKILQQIISTGVWKSVWSMLFYSVLCIYGMEFQTDYKIMRWSLVGIEI
jgi:hypothetical protein